MLLCTCNANCNETIEALTKERDRLLKLVKAAEDIEHLLKPEVSGDFAANSNAVAIYRFREALTALKYLTK